MSEKQKPPLGLQDKRIAHQIWREQRFDDVLKAIARYHDANKKVPLEWTDELHELNKANNDLYAKIR